MKAWLGAVAAVAMAVAVTGCESDREMKSASAQPAAGGDMLDAAAVEKAFKSGGSCKWTAGSQEGEDFYFATESPSQGVADRYVGEQSIAGTWAVKGDKLCLNFGTETCYGLSSSGGKTYQATAGGMSMELKC